MFGLGKKKTASLNFSTDIHCHILPGLDDGSSSMEESLQMAALMEKAGIRHIYATPHIKGDTYPNDSTTIARAATEFSSQLAKRNIGIKFNFAAEYFIDMFFMEKLESGEEFLTLDGKHILVESSMRREPLGLFDTLFKLQTRGYRPVMAHPERYAYYGKDPVPFRNLRKAGCLLQLNLFSLSGGYGKDVKGIAEMLVKNDLVDLIGTDSHRPEHAERLTDNRVLKAVEMVAPANDKLFGNI
ncbi:MAG: capsular biosynthesis protein [Rikenellaceae bacterium]|nr:capsular biosynthesis protein [Rikenellaceae bacterium]